MKQRLVGTIVLGCLALIFIPMLLDGEGIQPPALNLDIPPRPTIARTPIEDPVRPTLTEDTVTPGPAEPQLELPPFTPDAAPPPPPDTAAAEGAGEADAIDEASAAAAADSAAEPPPATVAPTPEQVPAIAANGLPEGWVVRLGTFGDRRNADKLLDELLAADYKAYVEPVPTAQGELNGVFVGPVLTRAEADDMQRALKTRFRLDGLVRRFSLDETP